MSGPSSSSRDGICCSGGSRIREPERFGPAALGAVRIDLGVDAIADEVREDVALEKLGAGVVVLVRGRDQLRQPVLVRPHPPQLAGLEDGLPFAVRG